jgi:hypothetical protein
MHKYNKMIDQNRKCIKMCGVNVSNIFTVGLLSSLIGAGIAYFVLIRSVDFEWWGLLFLWGAQFLSVIAVAYGLQKTLKFNNMFCETPLLVATYDWSSLCTTPVTAPKIIQSDSSPAAYETLAVNAADWEDLLTQLDQMAKPPTPTNVTIKIPVSDIGCMPAPILPPPPASAPPASTFDFSTIASALATSGSGPAPTSAPVTAPPSPAKVTPVTIPTPIIAPVSTSTPAKITPTPPAPTPAPMAASAPENTRQQTVQGIDFAALFR